MHPISFLNDCAVRPARPTGSRPVVRWAAVILGVVLTATTGPSQTASVPAKVPKPILIPEANRLPDANDQMAMRERKQRKVNFEAANTERLRQLTEESGMLLTMAMALKAEVDNTKSDKLSDNALHKADVIEKLARDVKDKMKLTVAPN